MSRLVLVVDDDQEIREMLCVLLQINGFATDEAEDGLVALQKIREQPPHIVVLDVMMPNMDGITLCRLLRQEPETNGLPIVMLSGKAHPHAVEDGLRAGADRYLIKPSGLDVLIATLHELLQYALAEQRCG
ncbi:MAG: response regulator [Ardenticatenaceae bacterium]|nr:response regulator [Ardenticatenaceae bacterium]MCB9442705.1 response regulator [Ardenticatenaceae bacterium]